jgi:mono/diheme cytochrome c family protein
MFLRLLSPLIALALLASRALGDDTPQFSRDILPILSDNCLACHGPDENKRKAGRRLDTREGATATLDGFTAIVPGKPGESELLLRIESSDPDEVMPPPKSHKKKLTAEQTATLRRWIAAGASWGKHWAFEPPRKTEPPPIADFGLLIADWKHSTNPIDAFVADRLAKERLTPSPSADPSRLIRRMSLDLTGLPPTPEQADAFARESISNQHSAISNAAARLLGSPHFGERLAAWWLDAARYADTDGFQDDETRKNWPWRDWVVAAFNANMPFDRFTVEQFAGDLLPDATAEQKLATCFHRNHMTNGEGGRDPEESRIDYVIDRVNTTGTLWLGLTVGCAQCHTHKFDPITHRDYYAMSAFFNSIDEDGKAGKAAKPYLTYESPHTQRAVDEAQRLVDERKVPEAQARKAAEKPFDEWLTARVAEVQGGYNAWRALRGALEAVEGTTLVQEEDGTVQAGGANPVQDDYRLIANVKLPRITGLKLEVLPHASHTDGGLSRGKSGFFTLTDIKVQVRRKGSAQIREVLIAGAIADVQDDPKKHNGYGEVKHVLDDDPRNGWSTRDHDPKQPRTALFAFAEPLTLGADEELVFELRHRSTDGDANLGRFRISATDQRGPAVSSLETAPLEQLAATPEPDAKLRTRLFDQFLADYAPYVEAKAELDRASKQFSEVKAGKKVDVMVLAERKEPRVSHILLRGVWDKKGDKVECDIPPAIAPWIADAPRTRLGFAQWIVSRENPLTARVIVNHLWQLCFGEGLVRTPEDFGLQGERPTYPELLDWLAVDFMESGWDVKRMLYLIVTSRTYSQSSDVSEALLARDPENRLLARGARFRLPSWMLRDAALKSAGLLNEAIGGPPVRPYQPAGVWEEMFMGRFRYEPSEGAAQYRRTLYAFWRRAIAPTFLFDSAQRRVCEVRQARTNTPLQALALLNDAGYLEASRAIAASALRAFPEKPARIAEIVRRVLLRAPSDAERAVLQRELDRALAYYGSHPHDTAKLLAVGQSPPDAALPAADLAAYMLVATLVLNLDEAITHE